MKKRKNKQALLAEKAFQEAVAEALEKHSKLGVPAVFMKDGKIVYRLPDGRIVDKEPRH